MEEPVEGYDEWFRSKVERGRAELDAGKGVPSDEVERMFEARRREESTE